MFSREDSPFSELFILAPYFCSESKVWDSTIFSRRKHEMFAPTLSAKLFSSARTFFSPFKLFFRVGHKKMFAPTRRELFLALQTLIFAPATFFSRWNFYFFALRTFLLRREESQHPQMFVAQESRSANFGDFRRKTRKFPCFIKCAAGRPYISFDQIEYRINVKLGGINVIPKKETVRFLTDPSVPTLVLGADVMHPPPGVGSRPSYAAVTGNVDSETSKYIATSRAQKRREEMITELEEMVAVRASSLLPQPSHQPIWVTVHPRYVHEIPTFRREEVKSCAQTHYFLPRRRL